jgi:hypothetical protein
LSLGIEKRRYSEQWAPSGAGPVRIQQEGRFLHKQRDDVIGRIAQCAQRFAFGERDRLVEFLGP